MLGAAVEPVGLGSSSPVAIVDDHGDTAESLVRFLEAAGFPAVAFTDSADFLAAFESIRPCAVVLDVAMPRIDGLAVLRRLRSDFNSGVPVIVLSGGMHRGEVTEMLLLGVSEVMQKPPRFEELLEILRDACVPPPAQ